MISFTILTAFIIDLLIGDPVYRAHPVRLIGFMITFFERPFRSLSNNMVLNGFFFTVSVLCCTLGCVLLPLLAVNALSRSLNLHFYGMNVLTLPFAVFIIYSGLSVKDLRDKAMEIHDLLTAGKIQKAREQVAMIVGRDTAGLDEGEIVRAVVETISENSVDGILSPLFYAFLGGAPGIALYKAVNTLDSMVGYKNERYLEFGRASAILDDILNFIPARLSPFFIALSALITRNSLPAALKIALRDGKKNPSPNSGISEAAYAGALGIQLGGVNYYGGIKSVKSRIGDEKKRLSIAHIKKALHITYALAILAVMTGIVLHAGFRFLISV